MPFYINLLIGFYFNEDNLGKASFDALYHFDMSKKFNENFFETFVLFGSDNPGYATRNSPIFWIFLIYKQILKLRNNKIIAYFIFIFNCNNFL